MPQRPRHRPQPNAPLGAVQKRDATTVARWNTGSTSVLTKKTFMISGARGRQRQRDSGEQSAHFKKLKGDHGPAQRHDPSRVGRAERGKGVEKDKLHFHVLNKLDSTKAPSRSSLPDLTSKHPDLQQPVLTTNSRNEPFRVRLSEPLHLRNDEWMTVAVDMKEPGTWLRIDSKYVVVGDCKYTLREVEVVPGIIPSNPEHLVLWLRAAQLPTFLTRGQIIAQLIPIWGPY